MNVNYGLFPTLEGVARRIPKREKHERLAQRALEALAPYADAAAEGAA
jgi:folate-dependent tRNA-U54 methylase TrmFO/GidA